MQRAQRDGRSQLKKKAKPREHPMAENRNLNRFTKVREDQLACQFPAKLRCHACCCCVLLLLLHPQWLARSSDQCTISRIVCLYNTIFFSSCVFLLLVSHLASSSSSSFSVVFFFLGFRLQSLGLSLSLSFLICLLRDMLPLLVLLLQLLSI